MNKEILDKHLQKIGGLAQLKTLNSIYIEGTAEIKGSGLSGVYKEWRKYATDNYCNKIEVDLGVYRETNGFIDDIIWKQDTSNKVTNETSEHSISECFVKNELERYLFLSNSEDVKVETEDDNDYHILKLNYIKQKISVQLFINHSTLLIDKKIEEKQDATEVTKLSDYRSVNGVLFPFKMEVEEIRRNEITIIKIANYSFEGLPDAIFAMPENGAIDFDFGGKESVEDIPIKYWGSHLFVDVIVNGEKGNFIIDSGAGKSVLDNEFCKFLKLEKKGNMAVGGVGHSSEKMSFVSCETLSVNDLTLKNQVLIAIDLKRMLMPIYGFKVDGILGFDFFSRFITKIDYANEKLSVYNPENFNYKGDGAIISFEIDNNIPKAPVKVNEIHTGSWSIDTGATLTSFHYPYAKENNFHDEKGLYSIASGVGGDYMSKRIRFEKLQIGGYTIDNPSINFPDKPSEGVFASKSKLGNLGNDVLRHFVVYFDYTNNKLILEKGDNFNKVFPENQTGFLVYVNNEFDSLTPGSNTFFIKHVSPESIGEKANIKQDDIIVEVNGKPASAFENVVELRKVFKQPFGTEINLKVKRNNEIKNIKFVLEKII